MEIISDKQAISLIVLFLIGESSIFIEGISAGKDLWISIILAILLSLPVMAIFARLNFLFPYRNLFDIMQICFGKYLGKACILAYVGFAIHTTSLIIDDVGFFISTTAINETPFLVIIILFSLSCAFAVKQGMEVLGRWAEFFVILPIIFEVLLLVLLIPKMNPDNIQPILYKGLYPVIHGTFLSLTFPFCYTIGFAMVFCSCKNRNSPYKIYIVSLLIGGIIVLATSLADILTIGPFNSSILYYPSSIAVSRIKVGNFLQRLEIVSATIFLLGIYIEASIYLLAACKGIAKLFCLADYRFIVLPVTLLVINLGAFDFPSIMRYFEWSTNIWPYYVFPFEVVIPTLLWLTAEIKSKKSLSTCTKPGTDI